MTPLENIMARWVLVLATVLTATAAWADVSMPAVFSDNMILQRDLPVRIWGWADAGEDVTVSLHTKTATPVFNQQVSTKADAAGKWSVKLKPLVANGNELTLTVAGKNTLTFTNILAGDVWICSGQSNMEWPVAASLNPKEECAAANFPNIRLFTVPHTTSPRPADDVATKGGWAVCSPQTVGGFSAVAYFFGREIHQKTQVPIGLINTSWGGTAIEPWMPLSALEAIEETRPRVANFRERLAAFEKDRKLFELKVQAARLEGEFLRAKWFVGLMEADPGAKASWQDPATDVSGWARAAVPMDIQKNEFNNYLGFGWVRKDVEIPAAWVGKELTLRLGPIDDGDVTYVNGVEVGSMWIDHHGGAWQTPRRYTIPAALTNGRKLTIVVRLYNMMGAIGLLGDASQYTLLPVDGQEKDAISLAGEWRLAMGGAIDPRTQPQVPQPSPPGAGWGEVAALHHAMIAPLTDFGIRGAIWYQGESNGNQGTLYGKLLPGMIGAWRAAWGYDFPFYVVQLANFLEPAAEPVQKDSWAGVREAQLQTAQTMDRVGLAVTIDVGEAADIHPRNKQDVGRRLALWALAKDYGQRDLVYSGPWWAWIKVEGSTARLGFDHVGGGLVAKGDELTGFAIAGEDKVFYAATAEIKGNEVHVSHPKVETPVAVRYGWSFNPLCNLYNKENLPASPFRTDSWDDKDIKAEK